MRRWRFHNRLRPGRGDPRGRDRARLEFEELEGREVLSPVVVPPEFFPPAETLENVARDFPQGSESSFTVFESNTATAPYDVVAVLSTSRGTFQIDESIADDYALTVADNGTAAVTLTGRIDFLNQFLSFGGFTFTPADFYSGDADIGLEVTKVSDPSENAAGAFNLKVIPDASPATLAWAATDEVRLRTEPFAFPPGFLAISNAPDTDGSETFSVTLSLGVDDSSRTGEFSLAANGALLPTAGEPGLWVVEARGPAAFQALLDSLVLTPPADFSGRASLFAFGSVRDDATYPSDASTRSDTAFFGAGGVSLRFFEAARFTIPPVFALEGSGLIDFGGRYAVQDPAELDEDSHTLTLSVPRGTLTFDPAAVPAGLAAARDGNTILLSGELAAINQFLATPGSLTYTPETPIFSGRVPLTLTLVNHPGEPEEFEGGPPQLDAGSPAPPTVAVAEVSVIPVAGHAFPTAADATTTAGTPVALALAVTPLDDTDGSESVVVYIDGVPAGASFNRGTNLGGGEWAFTPADLAGLTFTPPPGATGSFTMTMRAVVTDTAPDLGLTDTETDADTFTVVVNPAPGTPGTPNTPGFLLSPDFDDFFDFDALDPIVVDDSLDVGETDDDLDDDFDDSADAQVPFAGYTGGATTDRAGIGATENGVDLVATGPGSLFAQTENEAANYPYEDNHPLGPVLPLDQTSPVAVYSDSGGDSIALVDKLYRDAAGGEAPAPPLGATVESAVGIALPTATPAPEVAQPPAAAPAPVEAEVAAPAAAEDTAEASGWYPYAAAGMAAGALAAWFARGRLIPLGRSARHLMYAAIRHHSKGGAT